MTAREWFRILRMEEWQRDPARVLDIAALLEPVSEYDVDKGPLPVLPAGTFLFWRNYQPEAEIVARARRFAYLAGIELADTKIELIKNLMRQE